MNDRELDIALAAMGARHTQMRVPPRLREQVRTVPVEVGEQRSWLPHLDNGGFHMFSALKYVAAGVIVALFGGFLLNGILTTPQGDEMAPAAVTESPSPVTTGESLSGMVTEEVEPGVFRVLNDGVRDLSKPNSTDIVAGQDGGIWLLRPRHFHRLGSAAVHAWPVERPEVAGDFHVAPDGSFWALIAPSAEDRLTVHSHDGERWTSHPQTRGSQHVDVGSDGRAWSVLLRTPDDDFPTAFGYFDGDDWQSMGEVPSGSGFPELLVSPTGDVWASEGGEFHRLDDGAWHTTGRHIGESRADVGPDGTVWGSDGDALHRWDGKEWLRWPIPANGGIMLPLRAAPDRSVWVGWDIFDCRGIGHFDGVAWDRFLRGRCLVAMDVAADGTVWLLATEPDADVRDLYAITPEAVAATE